MTISALQTLVEEITREVISEEVPQVTGGDTVNPLVGTLRKAKASVRATADNPELAASQEKQIDTLITKLLTKRKGRANLSRNDMEALDKWTRWMTFLPFGRAYRRGLAKYLRSKKDVALAHKEDPFRDFRRYTYDTDTSPFFRENANDIVENQDKPESEPTPEPTKYYHGTNIDLKPGSLVLPPSKTKRVSEKGRKKNLDVVFFTKDPRSALIYAGRAVQSLGGGVPTVYQVEPMGPISVLNDDPGTTVLSAPYAKVVGKVKFEKKKNKKTQPSG